MQKKTLRILLLEENPERSQNLRTILLNTGPETFFVDTEEFFPQKPSRNMYPYDLIIVSGSFPHIESRPPWEWLTIHQPSIPVIVLLEETEKKLEKKIVAADILFRPEISAPLLRRAILLAHMQAQNGHTRFTDLLQTVFASLADDVTVVDSAYRTILSNRSPIPHDNSRVSFPICYNETSENMPCEWCRVRDVFKTGQKEIVEVPNAPDGGAWEMTFTPLHDKNGRVSLVVEHKRDITHKIAAQEALRQSETRYRTLTDNIPNGIVVMFDQSLHNTVVTGGALHELGFTQEMVTGRRLRDLIPDSRGRLLEKQFRKALDGEESWFSMEFQSNYFDIHVLPITDEFGKVTAGMAVGTDTSEERKARRESEASGKRFKALFENSRDGICVYERIKGSTERRPINCNAAYAKLSGRSTQELMACSDIGQWQSMPQNKQIQLQHKILREEPCSGSFMWIRPDNKPNHMEFRAMPVREGDRVLIYEIVRDMTDRVRSEAALVAHSATLERTVTDRTTKLREALKYAEEARERMDVILKSVADGLIVADMDGQIVMLNRSAERLLNAHQIDLQGRDVATIMEELDTSGNLAPLLKAKKFSDSPIDFSLCIGENITRYMRARISPVRDRAGETIGIVTTMDDVTREREVDQMKDEFISTAAHELRIPLTTILGFSELMTTRPKMSRNDINHYSNLIHQSALTLSSIVSDLLDISRIESGKGFAVSIATNDLKALVARTAETYTAKYPKHTFTFLPPENSVFAAFDPDKIRQVLENILSNAAKYSPPNTQVIIRIKESGRWVTLSVTDHGVGMNNEQVKRIFEKFYRGHADDGNIQGTGLGMSIAKHIITNHGGYIWVSSTPGKGTTVHLSLPTATACALNTVCTKQQ